MSAGFTNSENYLLSLAQNSFLRFWSWPNLFRDQKSGGKDGKELCDLLVVFGDDVLIFSDKLCAFPESGNIHLDWSRWYRRAVDNSAKQAVGAKRWLEQHPDRVYVDPSCSKKLPIRLPDTARYHLIVVAHGSGERCAKFFDDSPSLMVNTSCLGRSHFDPAIAATPFHIGIVLPDGPFVHVLDDYSLGVVMHHLDTANDFIDYLRERQNFLTTHTVVAVGEEEMLG